MTRNKTIRILINYGIVWLNLLYWANFVQGQVDHDVYHILLLQAYHEGLEWTDGVTRGFLDSLEKQSDVELSVEYMDTKRFPPPDYYDLLEKLYQKKYQQAPIDVLVVCDNNALDFVLTRREKLFSGVPIVFCGINNFSRALLRNQTQITGVIEELDIAGTIEFALAAKPEIKRFVVVNDETPTGLNNQARFETVALHYHDQIDFEVIREIPLIEMKQRLSRLGSDTGILVFTYHHDADGHYYSTSNFIRLLSENSSAPIFSFWEHYLGTGIVGGIMISGEAHGRMAADLAKRILAGESPDTIPIVEESPNIPMIDYRQMKRFGIPPESLPPGTVIKFKPFSLYESYRELIWATSIVLIVLVMFIVVLIRLLTRQKETQFALRESELRFRRLTENARDIIYRMSIPDGSYIYVSPAVEQITGYQPQEWYENPKKVQDLIHPNWRDYFAIQWARLLQGDIPDTYEYQIITKSGQIKWLFQRNTLVKDNAGRPTALDGIVTDITELKQAESELRSERDILERIMEASPAGITILNSQGDIEFANARAEEVLGLTRDNITQLKYNSPQWKIVDQTGRSIDVEQLPFHIVKRTGRMVIDGRHAIEDSLGKRRLLSINAAPILGEGGQVDKVIAIVEDITEEIEAERILKNSQDALYKAQSIARMGNYYYRPETGEFYLADTIRYALGLDHEISSLAGWLDMVHYEDRAELQRLIQWTIDESKSWEMEFRLHIGQSSREIWLHCQTDAEVDSRGKTVSVIGMLQEITDWKNQRREREALIAQLEDKNRELEQFVYSVSHDLKSPLITISGFSGLMLESINKGRYGELVEFHETIKKAVDQMYAVLNDLLELSRIGRLVNDYESVDFNEIIEDVKMMLHGELSRHEIEFEIAPSLPVVYVDRQRLIEAMQNVISNAMKYMGDQAHPAIAIGYETRETHYLFWVRDNGIGIDGPYLTKIFGLFEKLDRSTEGSGIGLAIVKRIIETHGGTIWAESEGLGYGSTIKFTIPIPDKSNDRK